MAAKVDKKSGKRAGKDDSESNWLVKLNWLINMSGNARRAVSAYAQRCNNDMIFVGSFEMFCTEVLCQRLFVIKEAWMGKYDHIGYFINMTKDDAWKLFSEEMGELIRHSVYILTWFEEFEKLDLDRKIELIIKHAPVLCGLIASIQYHSEPCRYVVYKVGRMLGRWSAKAVKKWGDIYDHYLLDAIFNAMEKIAIFDLRYAEVALLCCYIFFSQLEGAEKLAERLKILLKGRLCMQKDLQEERLLKLVNACKEFDVVGVIHQKALEGYLKKRLDTSHLNGLYLDTFWESEETDDISDVEEFEDLNINRVEKSADNENPEENTMRAEAKKTETTVGKRKTRGGLSTAVKGKSAVRKPQISRRAIKKVSFADKVSKDSEKMKEDVQDSVCDSGENENQSKGGMSATKPIRNKPKMKGSQDKKLRTLALRNGRLLSGRPKIPGLKYPEIMIKTVKEKELESQPAASKGISPESGISASDKSGITTKINPEIETSSGIVTRGISTKGTSEMQSFVIPDSENLTGDGPEAEILYSTSSTIGGSSEAVSASAAGVSIDDETKTRMVSKETETEWMSDIPETGTTGDVAEIGTTNETLEGRPDDNYADEKTTQEQSISNAPLPESAVQSENLPAATESSTNNSEPVQGSSTTLTALVGDKSELTMEIRSETETSTTAVNEDWISTGGTLEMQSSAVKENNEDNHADVNIKEEQITSNIISAMPESAAQPENLTTEPDYFIHHPDSAFYPTVSRVPVPSISAPNIRPQGSLSPSFRSFSSSASTEFPSSHSQPDETGQQNQPQFPPQK